MNTELHPSTPLLPVGIQTFEDIRRGGYSYIDKTHYLAKLMEGGFKSVFLSRPHRFGKSLFVSTLQAYFEGKKALFEGLHIAQVEEELARKQGREPWETSPVFYFSLNAENYTIPQALEKVFISYFSKWEALYGCENIEQTLAGRFSALIRKAYEQTGKKVVILVDEYDKPLLETFDHEELNQTNRTILKSFYEVLKKEDESIRFAFLTGITKFSKVVLFSGLNNLVDITLADDYSAICGFTEEELTSHFAAEIEKLATKYQQTVEEARAMLKKNYDGYRFSGNGVNVYNPFSLLNVLAFSNYKHYWFETATPSFLVKYLQQIDYYVPEIKDGVEIEDASLQDFRIGAHNPLPILFQTGYLTIKDYEPFDYIYRLRYPNEEVKYGFLRTLLVGYYPTVLDAAVDVRRFREDILRGDVETFMKRLEAIIARIPYGRLSKQEEVNYHERDGQVAIFLVFSLLGQFIQAEVHNHIGRADAVLQTPNAIYIFEFKLEGTGTPEEALQQIEEKGYALSYPTKEKQVFLVGVSFNEGKKNIGSWLVKMLA